MLSKALFIKLTRERLLKLMLKAITINILIYYLNLAPFHYVRWIRDETLVVDSRNVEVTPRITLFSNGSLLVSQLRPEDTGEYICEIKTYAGFMDTQAHAIEVQRK